MMQGDDDVNNQPLTIHVAYIKCFVRGSEKLRGTDIEQKYDFGSKQNFQNVFRQKSQTVQSDLGNEKLMLIYSHETSPTRL
jgi:hypothetical protein